MSEQRDVMGTQRGFPQGDLATAVTELRVTCGTLIEQGGEAGSIAADVLRISHELSAMTDDIERFLKA